MSPTIRKAPAPPARTVGCPTCGAQPGERCTIHSTETDAVHATRTRELEALQRDTRTIR